MKVTYGGAGRRNILPVLAVCLVALCSDAGATTTQDDLKMGAQLEKQGQLFKAAEVYARVLRSKPGDNKARSALVRIVDQAFAERLSAAAALEHELRLQEAIAEVEAARRLKERLSSLKIEVDQPNAVESRMDQLITNCVQALLLEAERARADGLWSAALAHLQQVEALKPGFEDTRDRLHDVWVAWGDTNLAEGRLRAAAERFEQAARVAGRRSGTTESRAATIRAGLGMWGLNRGACRAAVVDLRAAERLAPGSVGVGALEQAAACAATCAQLKVTADTGSGLDDVQLAHLKAEFHRQVAAGASEFLQLKDTSAGAMRGCNRRIMPGVGGQPMNGGPYSAAVRVTAISVIRKPASSLTRQMSSQNGWVDTAVTYEEYLEVLIGTMSGWVTLTDQGAAGVSVPLPVKVNGEVLARWQRNPMSTVTSQDHLTGRRTTGVMIEGSGRGKAQADEARRQARASLTETLVRNFAAEAGRVLLATVDLEPAVPDPTELPEPMVD